MVADQRSAEIVAAGVDWITLTSPRDGRDLQLLVAADAILEHEEQAGNKLSRIHWQRYDLRKCGGASAGLRDDGALVRLSGETARTHWRSFIPYARTVTRIDVQSTVRPAPPRPDLGAVHLAEALAWAEGRERSPRITYHGSKHGVECVYLGSRTSEAFGRVYDKFRESNDPALIGTWRYEVEAKGDLAGNLSRALYHERDDVRACGVYVHDFYRARGIGPVYDRGRGILHAQSHRVASDDERRLKWLAEQVSHVLVELAEHGRRNEALLALGLADMARDSDGRGPP
jgi:hypothetical protein